MKYSLTAIFITLSIFAASSPARSQGITSFLESNDKINVVVLVLATIFAGIVAFLIYLERRLSKIERQQKES